MSFGLILVNMGHTNPKFLTKKDTGILPREVLMSRQIKQHTLRRELDRSSQNTNKLREAPLCNVRFITQFNLTTEIS